MAEESKLVDKLIEKTKTTETKFTEEEYAKKYQETQVKEKEVATELNDKYGSGNLDPQTGVFTPNS